LYNLFSGENSPGDGVGTFTVGICTKISSLVDGIISDEWIPLNLRDQGG